MRVGICDDVEADRKSAKELCRQVIGKLEENLIIKEFCDGKEALEQQGELDILLLDMEMPNVNGLEVKQRMEQEDANVMIIYLTGHSELVFDGFGRNVLAFVQKSEIMKQLPLALEKAANYIMKNIWIDDEISSRRIMYIQASDNYQLFYYRNKKREIRAGRMEKLEQLLEKADFIRTHRKYLVNMYYVDEIKKGKMIVRGKEIPIAARAQKEVKEKYAEFRRKRTRLC